MLVKQIIIHHTVSSRDKTTIADIDAWHKLRWPDFKSSLGFWIGYHYVIAGDGKITQTRLEMEKGAHAPPNESRLGIALTGNFDVETPSLAQLTSLQGLLEKLKKEYQFTDKDIFGHNEKSITECPGRNLIIWLDKFRQISALQQKIEAIKKLIAELLKVVLTK